MGHQVESIWVALSEYDGDEGPVMVVTPFGAAPLFHTRSPEIIRLGALGVARAEGRTVRVCRFDLVEVVEVIGPG